MKKRTYIITFTSIIIMIISSMIFISCSNQKAKDSVKTPAPIVKEDPIKTPAPAAKPETNDYMPGDIYYKSFTDNGYKVSFDYPTFLLKNKETGGSTPLLSDGYIERAITNESGSDGYIERTITNESGSIRIMLSMRNNNLNENINQNMLELRQSIHLYKVYSLYQENWAIISYDDGKDISYLKSFVGTGHIVDIAIIYPSVNKKKMDSIIENIIGSLKVNDLDLKYNYKTKVLE